MCGRYVLTKGGQWILDYFGIPEARADEGFRDWEARYNIAPTTMVPGLYRTDADTRAGLFKWGLLPFWAGIKDGFKTINARSEEIHQKASFKNPIQKRRCLLPADGYYEWKGEKGNKQPFYFSRPNGEPLTFAGVWESWKPKGSTDNPILTCSVLTTAPNTFGAQYHDRMPVVIHPEHRDYWMDPNVQNVDDIRELFGAVPEDYLIATAVDKAVGNVKTQGAQCIEPMTSLF